MSLWLWWRHLESNQAWAALAFRLAPRDLSPYGGQRWSRTTVLGFSDRRANRVRHLPILRRQLDSNQSFAFPHNSLECIFMVQTARLELAVSRLSVGCFSQLNYACIYSPIVHSESASIHFLAFFNPERSDNYSGRRMEPAFFGNANHFWL